MNKIKHRKSKFLCILLSCILILTMSGSVYAKSKPTSGSCGKYITWDYNKKTKTLRFSGKGKMQDTDGAMQEFGDIGSWQCWNEDVKHIVIGEGITEIGEANFTYFSHIYSISLPKSLIKVGDYSFFNCTFKKISLIIPPNVKEIGENAFAGYGSNRLEITSLKLPNGLKEIGKGAFGYNIIKEVTIPESVTKLGRSIFNSCYKLEKVYLPRNMKRINEEIFMDCDNLKKISIPDTVTSIEEAAFYRSGLTKITIPNNVKRIGAEAFYCCDDLKKVVLPNQLKVIKPALFSDCTKLKSVEIPDSVTTVSMSAFTNTPMKEIILPKNVKKIKFGAMYHEYAFMNNKELKRIVITSENVEFIQRKSFSGLNDTCVIQIPASRETKYRKMLIDSGVKEEQIIVEE